MGAAAQAIVVVVVVFVVIVVTVIGVVAVVGVIAIVATIAGVTGASVLPANELTYQTKVVQAVSTAGICSCPLPAIKSSNPFPCMLPSLQRNEKRLETDDHMPKSLT